MQYNLLWNIFSPSQVLGTHCDGTEDPMALGPVTAFLPVLVAGDRTSSTKLWAFKRVAFPGGEEPLEVI